MPPGELIRDLPRSERPRERLLKEGSGALSDAELLAVLLRIGSPGRSAVRLAADLLHDTGGLAGLLGRRPRDLMRPGVIGPAKAASVMAAVEIGRRLARSRLPERILLGGARQVADYLHVRYADRHQEMLGALYLDAQGRLLAERELYRGTLSRLVAEPRLVLREAILAGASAVVVFHNHPSGDPAPSLEDVEFTRQLAAACKAVGVELTDHLILADGGRWTSLRRRGAW